MIWLVIGLVVTISLAIVLGFDIKEVEKNEREAND